MGIKMKPVKPRAKSASDTVNAQQLGAVLGISRASIANLATDRVLPRASRGEFGLAACVQAYIRHKLLQAGAADIGAKTLVAERSRLAKFKADQAERESQIETGELVNVNDVDAAWQTVVRTIHSRLLVIPTKVAPRAATLTTAVEVQTLLQKELNAALAGIAAAPAF
jgi:phage terminase Nu1 subunit (DNA packaging protein)